MSHTISFNKSHSVSSDFCDYVYKLPRPVQFSDLDSVAFVSSSIYYSWFNIDSKLYGNNIIEYIWPGATATAAFEKYTITIPDGNYSITTLNELIIIEFTARGHYLMNNSIKYYYLDLVVNTTFYKIQMRNFSWPNPMTGYSYGEIKDTAYPSWVVPTSKYIPKWVIPAVATNMLGISAFLGFSSGTYPSSNKTTSYSVYSDLTPQVEQINEINIYCNLIKNPYASNDTYLYSVSPQGYSSGDVVKTVAPTLRYDNINEGLYSFITLKFRDQDGNRISFKEPIISATLSILSRKN